MCEIEEQQIIERFIKIVSGANNRIVSTRLNEKYFINHNIKHIWDAFNQLTDSLGCEIGDRLIVKYGYGGVDVITIILSDDDTVTIEGMGMIGSNNCRPTKVSITVSIDNVKSIVDALIAMRDYFVREHQAYLQRAEARKRLCARFKKRK